MWLLHAMTDLKTLHMSVDFASRDLTVNDQRMKELKDEYEELQYFSVSDIFLAQVWQKEVKAPVVLLWEARPRDAFLCPSESVQVTNAGAEGGTRRENPEKHRC